MSAPRQTRHATRDAAAKEANTAIASDDLTPPAVQIRGQGTHRGKGQGAKTKAGEPQVAAPGCMRKRALSSEATESTHRVVEVLLNASFLLTSPNTMENI